MPLDSCFVNLVRGNRLQSYMGLQEPEGKQAKYGAGYVYVEIPVRELRNATTGELLEKGLRNQQVLVLPDCTVHARSDYHILVEPNRRLAEFGSVQAMYYIHPGEGEQVPSFCIALRKDMDLAELDFAVRLYLQV